MVDNKESTNIIVKPEDWVIKNLAENQNGIYERFFLSREKFSDTGLSEEEFTSLKNDMTNDESHILRTSMSKVLLWFRGIKYEFDRERLSQYMQTMTASQWHDLCIYVCSNFVHINNVNEYINLINNLFIYWYSNSLLTYEEVGKAFNYGHVAAMNHIKAGALYHGFIIVERKVTEVEPDSEAVDELLIRLFKSNVFLPEQDEIDNEVSPLVLSRRYQKYPTPISMITSLLSAQSLRIVKGKRVTSNKFYPLLKIQAGYSTEINKFNSWNAIEGRSKRKFYRDGKISAIRDVARVQRSLEKEYVDYNDYNNYWTNEVKEKFIDPDDGHIVPQYKTITRHVFWGDINVIAAGNKNKFREKGIDKVLEDIKSLSKKLNVDTVDFTISYANSLDKENRSKVLDALGVLSLDDDNRLMIPHLGKLKTSIIAEEANGYKNRFASNRLNASELV